MRLLWWLKYKHPVPSIVRTCRIVHGLPVYIVGYGPRVNGNLPGISSWICSVSALVYKGFMSMPCIKKKVVVKSIISEKHRKNVLSRLLSYKSFKMGWSESMKFCCWLSPVLGIKQFTCADKNIQFMRRYWPQACAKLTFLRDLHLSAVSWRVVPILDEVFACDSYDMNRLRKYISRTTKNNVFVSIEVVVEISFFDAVWRLAASVNSF